MDLDQFHGPNAGYVIELYDRYRDNPASVNAQTRSLFQGWTPPVDGSAPQARGAFDVQKVVGAARLARLTREYGHLAAQLDPLGSPPPGDYELELATHDLTEDDLAALPSSVIGGPCSEQAANALEAMRLLREIYCSSIGYDFDQVQISRERDWLRDAVETGRYMPGFSPRGRRALLERLTEVETFERFLHRAFPGQKWFAIEGLDMLVPMLDEVIAEAAEVKTREVVIGIAHRGRLNVLAHILGQPYETILTGFLHRAARSKGTAASDSTNDSWTGDVKYHLGATRRLSAGNSGFMPITLAPNPSHLEFVDPVVEGRARAAQETRDQPGPPVQDERASLAILIHGDAAFPGQGVVAETLNLSQLAGYRTGGTIHIIANNQLGFTSEPQEVRSTLYAGDLAKGFEIPIVHVNADNPYACLLASRLAQAYREEFQKDFLIDLVGYRRYGHNEADEPAFTQPVMYERIRQHPTVRQILVGELVRRGVVTPDEAQALVDKVQERLRHAQEQATASIANFEREATLPVDNRHEHPEAPVSANALRSFNRSLQQLPDGFTPNPKLERLFSRRLQALETGGIDWAHAEMLAFAATLADGTPIRLTGQDTERGTFSQRHLVLHDVRTGDRYTPLQALPEARASFAVHNSPLSENAALGFEYGYSAHAPGALVLWEAQFGDFANGAQVIIDQFIASGQAKWRQESGLVLLLPHGYEGQGPEHSSARLERFLQLAARDNMRIANVTTSAQYFHLLRRQAALLGGEPRPLVVMTPKSLLRNPLAASSLEDLTDVTFQPVLADHASPERGGDVQRAVLCSGKVYYDLISSELYREMDRIPVLRLEELFPFPAPQLTDFLSAYPALQRLIWVQEEPRNMGAWSFVVPRLGKLLGPEIEIGYVGRPDRASPAEGSIDLHNVEQARIVEAALKGEPDVWLRRREEVRHAG